MYRFTIRPRAESDLRRLSAPIHARILNKLQQLCQICDDYPHKALKGIHRGKYSLKVAKVTESFILLIDKSVRLLCIELDTVAASIRSHFLIFTLNFYVLYDTIDEYYKYV